MYAAIDLGTNSCRLLIGEVNDGRLHIHHDRWEVVQLGHGVDKTGRLDPERVEAVVALLADYARDCDRFHVEQVAAVATSAMRDAADRDAFLARVRRETQIPLELISGEVEARLSFRAAVAALATPPEEVIVVDFGGGSTEVILGRGNTVTEAVSLEVGSRRMLERFLTADPPTEAQWQAMMDHLHAALAPLPSPGDAAPLVGVGATVVHLSAMLFAGDGQHPFDSAALAPLTDRVRATPMAARRDFIGLDPSRADVIVAGCGLVTAFLDRFRRPIQPSPYSLRHGLLLDRFDPSTNR